MTVLGLVLLEIDFSLQIFATENFPVEMTMFIGGRGGEGEKRFALFPFTS